jgi:hypothetical protein
MEQAVARLVSASSENIAGVVSVEVFPLDADCKHEFIQVAK